MEFILNTRELLQILLNMPGIGMERAKNISSLYRDGQDLCQLIKNLYPLLPISEFSLNNAVSAMERIFQKAESLNINIHCYKDYNYPLSFLSLNDFPPLIYSRGNTSALNRPLGAALIGSRRASDSILKMTELIGEQLIQNGFSIVSGLALGCDTVAHMTAIKHKRSTIALMPCGPDVVYPRENMFLYDQIMEINGLILSEYEPGISPAPFRFVQRDRLQSGMSQIVVLMESHFRGGAMHTANAALKQKKPLFVYVPSYHNESNGGNRYLLNSHKVIPFSSPNEFAHHMKHMRKILRDCNRETDQLIFPYV